METKYLKINPADNVAVAIVTLPAGETHCGRSGNHSERGSTRRTQICIKRFCRGRKRH